MTPIENKKNELASRKYGKLIFNKTISDQKSAGSGGVFQEFEIKENTLCNIYSHPDVGTCEVHGAILDKYLKIGGTGNNPMTKKRELGFPKSDELTTKDGYAVESQFEWGSIFASYGAGAVPLYGDLYKYWKNFTGTSYMGYPLCEPISLQNKQSACFFENALLINIEIPGAVFFAGSHVIHLEYGGPLVGNPQVSPLEDLLISKCYNAIIPTTVWSKIDVSFPALLNEICTNRLFLESIKTKSRIAATLTILRVDPPAPDHPNTVKVKLSLSAKTLANRSLYNISVNGGNSTLGIIGLHCIYAKNQWESFGVIHATDLHLSITNDRMYNTLIANHGNGKSYTDTANKEYVNFNDNFRDLIRYANKLYNAGDIDMIMLTGDLIDFQYETFYDAAKRPYGNFLFLQHLIEGKNKSPKQGVLSEELLVPTLMCLGNHDYRRLSYLLNCATEIRTSDIIKSLEYDSLGEIIGGRTGEVIAFIGQPFDKIVNFIGNTVGFLEDTVDAIWDFFGGGDIPKGPRVGKQSNFGQYNLIQSEMNGIYKSEEPLVSPTRALNMIVVNEPNYYFNRINNKSKSAGSTITYLGANAILMIESGHDDGAPKGTDHADAANLAFDKTFKTGGESRQNMIGGDPNVIGITATHVEDLKQVLNDPKVTGTVLLGIHGPVVNINGNDYPPYFRESVYLTRKRNEVEGFLNAKYPYESHTPWLNSIGEPYFTTGNVENRLDSGTSNGLVDEFLRACAGKGVTRPVDLLLSGHIHRSVEFRIKWNSVVKTMEYYYDFYSENPTNYYNTKLLSVNNRNTTVTRILRDLSDDELDVREFSRSVNGKAVKYYRLFVKPYSKPLNNSNDKKSWWDSHRPLITQTAALGPLEGAQRDDPDAGKERIPEAIFQGFRVIKLKNNVIDKIHYVILADLRLNNYKMAWENEDNPRSGLPGSISIGDLPLG